MKSPLETRLCEVRVAREGSQESEAETLEGEVRQDGERVYITHRLARQSWSTTYPSAKTRVVSPRI